jgi:hypothetical protein
MADLLAPFFGSEGLGSTKNYYKAACGFAIVTSFLSIADVVLFAIKGSLDGSSGMWQIIGVDLFIIVSSLSDAAFTARYSNEASQGAILQHALLQAGSREAAGITAAKYLNLYMVTVLTLLSIGALGIRLNLSNDFGNATAIGAVVAAIINALLSGFGTAKASVKLDQAAENNQTGGTSPRSPRSPRQPPKNFPKRDLSESKEAAEGTAADLGELLLANTVNEGKFKEDALGKAIAVFYTYTKNGDKNEFCEELAKATGRNERSMKVYFGTKVATDDFVKFLEFAELIKPNLQPTETIRVASRTAGSQLSTRTAINVITEPRYDVV